MTDVATMIEKVGYRPTKEWVESTYKVELEEPEETKIEGPAPELTPEEAGVEEEVPEEQPAEETPEAEPAEEPSGDEELDKLIDEILG